MQPVIGFAVVSLQASKHRNSLMKLEADMNSASATVCYIQIFDWPTPADLALGLTAPANGSVPIKSYPAASAATNIYKEFKNGELACANGIFVCVSTTQANLTLGTGNNNFASIACENWSVDVVANEVSGQGVPSQAIFSDATGRANQRYLLRAAARNLNAGFPTWLQLFASNPVNGMVPLLTWPLLANTGGAPGGDTIYRDFGSYNEGAPTGIFVRAQDTSYVNHQGAFLALSTTPTVLTLDTGSGMNVYAEYTTNE